MSVKGFKGGLAVDLEKFAKLVNFSLPVVTVLFALLGTMVNFNFHFITVTLIIATLINFYYRHIQKSHTLLANFGLVAQARYMIESVGPEFRQYLFMSDTEEKPFNRIERNEIYRKSKGIDSSSAFGSQLNFDNKEIKLRHSMYPISKDEIKPYSLSLIHI